MDSGQNGARPLPVSPPTSPSKNPSIFTGLSSEVNPDPFPSSENHNHLQDDHGHHDHDYNQDARSEWTSNSQDQSMSFLLEQAPSPGPSSIELPWDRPHVEPIAGVLQQDSPADTNVKMVDMTMDQLESRLSTVHGFTSQVPLKRLRKEKFDGRKFLGIDKAQLDYMNVDEKDQKTLLRIIQTEKRISLPHKKSVSSKRPKKAVVSQVAPEKPPVVAEIPSNPTDSKGEPAPLPLPPGLLKKWKDLAFTSRQQAGEAIMGHFETVRFSTETLCPFCERARAHSKTDLLAHILSVHISYYPFPCPACNKSFASEKALRRHQCSSHGTKSPSPMVEGRAAPPPVAQLAPPSIEPSRGTAGTTLNINGLVGVFSKSALTHQITFHLPGTPLSFTVTGLASTPASLTVTIPLRPELLSHKVVRLAVEVDGLPEPLWFLYVEPILFTWLSWIEINPHYAGLFSPVPSEAIAGLSQEDRALLESSFSAFKNVH